MLIQLQKKLFLVNCLSKKIKIAYSSLCKIKKNIFRINLPFYMKKIFFLLSLFFINSVFANKIDSLKTDEDILGFISELYKSKYNSNNLLSFEKSDYLQSFITFDSVKYYFGSENWEKIDFNTDKVTDLFAKVFVRNYYNKEFGIYGFFTVIDKGNNKFEMQEIPEYFIFSFHTAKPFYLDKQPLIFYQHAEIKHYSDSNYFSDPLQKIYDSIIHVQHTDTLIYKFGAFIELNSKQQFSPNVKSIFFESRGSFMIGEAYKLIVYNDGEGNYLSDWSIDGAKEGNFRTKIKNNNLSEIFSLIKYLNVSNLENGYDIQATDLTTVYLKVYFEDGSIKEIRDYGEQGTLGLKRLYNLLSDLRHNQNWK
jgi:hypothetical protein